MKETDVKGLQELRHEYDEKLRALPGYEKLHTELEKQALDLIRQAATEKGLKIEMAALKSAKGEDCGFCQDCVTPCSGCVAYN